MTRLAYFLPRLFCLLAAFTHLLSATIVHAETVAITPTSPNGLQFAPSGPFALGRDSLVGTVIATASNTFTAVGFSGTCEIRQTFSSASTEVSPGSGVYATGLSGVGVKFFVVDGATRTQILGGSTVTVTHALNGPALIAGIEAQLVVDAQISTMTSPGVLNNLPAVSVAFALTGVSNDASCATLSSASDILQTTVDNPNVTALTCNVPNASLSVSLPVVSTNALSASGHTAGATRFVIPVNCSTSGANVYLTLSDARVPGNMTSLLNLSASSTATNVKLEITRDDGSLVLFGPASAVAGTENQWFAGASAGLSGIPLIVRYRADGGAATAGSVEADAVFTLSYQ